MTSHKQLQLEYAVLQERLAELEHTQAAADTRAAAEAGATRRRGAARASEVSTTSAAEMYAHLANSSDWSARQMGAIEGANARAPMLAGPTMHASRRLCAAFCAASDPLFCCAAFV